jgi:hypothetical protein
MQSNMNTQGTKGRRIQLKTEHTKGPNICRRILKQCVAHWMWYRSLGNSVGKMARLRAGRRRFDSRQKQPLCFTTKFWPKLVLIQPSTKQVALQRGLVWGGLGQTANNTDNCHATLRVVLPASSPVTSKGHPAFTRDILSAIGDYRHRIVWHPNARFRYNRLVSTLLLHTSRR